MPDAAALQQERSIGVLEGRVGALETRVENHEESTRAQFWEMSLSLKGMDEKLDSICAVINRQKGKIEGGTWVAIKLIAGFSGLVMLALTAYKVWH